jgi:transposase
LDCRHVCKTCASHDAVQAGKQKEVLPPYSPDLAPAGCFYLLFSGVSYASLSFAIFWKTGSPKQKSIRRITCLVFLCRFCSKRFSNRPN